jgi:hypothetical protein
MCSATSELGLHGPCGAACWTPRAGVAGGCCTGVHRCTGGVSALPPQSGPVSSCGVCAHVWCTASCQAEQRVWRAAVWPAAAEGRAGVVAARRWPPCSSRVCAHIREAAC